MTIGTSTLQKVTKIRPESRVDHQRTTDILTFHCSQRGKTVTIGPSVLQMELE